MCEVLVCLFYVSFLSCRVKMIYGAVPVVAVKSALSIQSIVYIVIKFLSYSVKQKPPMYVHVSTLSQSFIFV